MQASGNQFETTVELKVQELVSCIMESENYEYLDALEYLYELKFYNALTDESSKLWHLSTEKLFEILKNENRTKKLEYLDFV